VLLKAWPLEATMWDGEVLSGPVPTLFSEDIKRTEDGLRGKNTKIITLSFYLGHVE
jgi:hypothetical protein